MLNRIVIAQAHFANEPIVAAHVVNTFAVKGKAGPASAPYGGEYAIDFRAAPSDKSGALPEATASPRERQPSFVSILEDATVGGSIPDIFPVDGTPPATPFALQRPSTDQPRSQVPVSTEQTSKTDAASAPKGMSGVGKRHSSIENEVEQRDRLANRSEPLNAILNHDSQNLASIDEPLRASQTSAQAELQSVRTEPAPIQAKPDAEVESSASPQLTEEASVEIELALSVELSLEQQPTVDTVEPSPISTETSSIQVDSRNNPTSPQDVPLVSRHASNFRAVSTTRGHRRLNNSDTVARASDTSKLGGLSPNANQHIRPSENQIPSTTQAPPLGDTTSKHSPVQSNASANSSVTAPPLTERGSRLASTQSPNQLNTSLSARDESTPPINQPDLPPALPSAAPRAARSSTQTESLMAETTMHSAPNLTGSSPSPPEPQEPQPSAPQAIEPTPRMHAPFIDADSGTLNDTTRGHRVPSHLNQGADPVAQFDSAETASEPLAAKSRTEFAPNSPISYVDATTENAQSVNAQTATNTRSHKVKSVPAQVEQAIHAGLSRRGQAIEIRLDPPELGRVTIQVEADGPSVVAKLIVEDRGVATALENGVSGLIENLQRINIVIEDVTVAMEQNAPEHGSFAHDTAGQRNGDKQQQLPRFPSQTKVTNDGNGGPSRNGNEATVQSTDNLNIVV